MEDQKIWNSKFRSVRLKVLRNAVLLRYHAPESVHGARRTKQNKILNLRMAGIAVFLLFFFVNRNISHVEVWNLLLFRSPSSVNRFWSMVAQKNDVGEYFQKNYSKFEKSKNLILHFRIFHFLLSKMLFFQREMWPEMANISAIWQNLRYGIRYSFYLLLK